ncbi:hypothetical protein B0H21DRAFT_778910 [Amylocystis lapponica]|nr:hypothetical protein B0H21DRAFT_778910 [Amylocystis lapponica]
MNADEDRLVSVLPIHFSNALLPNVPPSAAASGKRVRRLEVHVPVDTRPEVWNGERSRELGKARNQESARVKLREGEEPRLAEVRMRSEQIPQTGAYVLGVVRDGRLHLHPISETHQLRPSLTYMDVLTRKNKRHRGAGGSDDDSDYGPPPDPDEPAPAPAPAPKKEKKPAVDAKEVQVSVRKAGDDKSSQFQGGLTAVRREMLMMIHAEEDAKWDDYDYCDGEAAESNEAFEAVFSQSTEQLECKTDITSVLKDIRGL